MGIEVTPNDSLSGDLEHQLSVALDLEQFVATNLRATEGSSTKEPNRTLFVALAEKSFATFHSITILMKARQYEDAAALVRILYESTMTASYLLSASEDQVTDYTDYFMYRNWRDHQLAVKINPNSAEAIAPATLKKMKEEFKQVEGRYSSGKWTQRSAEQMARDADIHLPDGFKVFNVLYAFIYRQCSGYVHSDVRSVQTRIARVRGGLIIMPRVIASESEGRLMNAANFLMLMACFLVSGTCYGKKYMSDWNKIVLRWNGNTSLQTEVST